MVKNRVFFTSPLSLVVISQMNLLQNVGTQNLNLRDFSQKKKKKMSFILAQNSLFKCENEICNEFYEHLMNQNQICIFSFKIEKSLIFFNFSLLAYFTCTPHGYLFCKTATVFNHCVLWNRIKHKIESKKQKIEKT